MRLVLDTSVLVAAFRSRSGASSRLLSLAIQNRFTTIVSATLFFEYESVLKRPEQTAVHQIDSAQIDRFLVRFAGNAEKVSLRFRWRPQLPDPDDEAVLETAINGRADAIVTHNVADFRPASLFGIKALTPGAILLERFTP